MLEQAARERRHNDDTDSAGHLREHAPGPLGDFFGRSGGVELAANPLAIFFAQGGLGSNLLREKAIGRSRGHASSGGVGLVKIAGVLEVGHDVADGRGT